MRRMSKWGAVLAALVLVLGATACGDDDDGDGDEGSQATTTAAERDEVETDEGEGDGEEQGAPDVNPCAEGESGRLGPPSEAPPAEATPVTITGTEYAFAGQEALASAGSAAITFTNEGNELHEMALVRIADDETRTVEELLQAEDADDAITDVAFAFACPGTTADPVAADLSEPGRYAMVCFIPVGTLPTTPPEDFETMGPPHALQGMVAEIQVG